MSTHEDPAVSDWRRSFEEYQVTPDLYMRRAFTVEAMQYDKDLGQEVAAWCGGTLHARNALFEYIEIPRPGGHSLAAPGDYIVRGIHGEFYPVSPRHFEAGYEPINRNRK